jgi:acyl carrier protein
MKKNEPQPINKEYREKKQSRPSEKKKTARGIIGMACRFPGAKTHEEYLENFKQRQSYIQEIPQTNAAPSSVAMTGQAVENHVKEIIAEELSESLKIDISLIGIDESFEDYGVDALTGVRLAQDISHALMIDLETTSIFGYSSINQLTKYILSRFKDVIVMTLEQNKKQIDINNDLPPIKPEKLSVYPYPKLFLKGRMLTEI